MGITVSVIGDFLSTAQKYNRQKFEHNRPGPKYDAYKEIEAIVGDPPLPKKMICMEYIENCIMVNLYYIANSPCYIGINTYHCLMIVIYHIMVNSNHSV